MVSASYSALLVILAATAVWASTPQAPSDGAGNCLTLSGGTSSEIYKACCGQTQSGKARVDGVEFSYSCGAYPSPAKNTIIKASSARECAHGCAAAGTDCRAAAWNSKGQCFFVTVDDYSPRAYKGFMSLEKTKELVSEPESEPTGGCGKATDAAKAECEKYAAVKCQNEKESDKAQCEQEKTAVADDAKKQAETDCQNDKSQLQKQIDDAQAKCNSQKDAASSQCQTDKDAAVSNANSQCAAEKEQLQKQTDDARSQCQTDKDAAVSNAVSNANSQCTAEKDQLQKQTVDARSQCQTDKDAAVSNAVSNANSQCAAEKDQLRQQGEGTLQQSKSQWEAEKATLENNLKTSEDKILSDANGHEDWKAVDSRCHDNSWFSLCDGRCPQRQFKLGGVDFQVKCNVRTNGAREEIWWYRPSILQCAEDCAMNPNCIAVGWRNFGGEPQAGVSEESFKFHSNEFG
ncbi:hypothetical protein N7520_001707 [Penicillium odoratum]|uniref:uncharacterized protein n=1 Tax=Penicillium odoratum TaxID=1167516 RepID=UPI002549865B|nr:uncharacterized protein N7520_001707 [Penicillium odoratum]KAJ5778461.1 hypothetical protein N7520_001707 [Penicillium odoratum]